MESNFCCYFRNPDIWDKHKELETCSKYFNTVQQRTEIPDNTTVISRYSCRPFYKELEQDLKNKNCKLLNTFEQHLWIANFDWYFEEEELQKYTPKTWKQYQLAYIKDDGPFVVKGATNSKKHKWNTHMYAETKADIGKVICNLLGDSLIEQQEIIVRKYEKLKTFEYGFNGLPFSNEWRYFFYKNKMLTCGYYWSTATEEAQKSAEKDWFDGFLTVAEPVARIVSKHVPFFVLDIAQKENGEWMLVEINDAQMSGLSEVKAELLYSNLKYELENEGKPYDKRMKSFGRQIS